MDEEMQLLHSLFHHGIRKYKTKSNHYRHDNITSILSCLTMTAGDSLHHKFCKLCLHVGLLSRDSVTHDQTVIKLSLLYPKSGVTECEYTK